MLVLTRKPGERIHIGHDIVVTVLETKHNRIRLGIVAPVNVDIMREEILVPSRQTQTLRSSRGSD